MTHMAPLIGIAGTLAVGGCAVAPPGPSVMALPGQGKSFATFQQDDAGCRNYASTITGGATSAQAANNAGVGSAVLGTALGAGAGAAIGAAAGNAGTGAAIGAATGLVAGSAVGSNSVYAASGNLQQRYDIGYTQCMYAQGNSVQSVPGGYAYPADAGGYGYSYGYGYPYSPYGYGYWGPALGIGLGGWGGYYGGWRGGYPGGWHGGGGWHH